MKNTVCLKDFINCIKDISNLLDLKTPIRKDLNVELSFEKDSITFTTINKKLGVLRLKINARIFEVRKLNISILKLSEIASKLKNLSKKEIDIILEENSLSISHQQLGKIKYKTYYQGLVLPKIEKKDKLVLDESSIKVIESLFKNFTGNGKVSIANNHAVSTHKLESGVEVNSTYNLDSNQLTNKSYVYLFDERQVTLVKNLNDINKIILCENLIIISSKGKNLVLYSQEELKRLYKHSTKNLIENNPSNQEIIVDCQVAKEDLKDSLNWQNTEELQEIIILELNEKLNLLFKGSTRNNKSQFGNIKTDVFKSSCPIQINLSVGIIRPILQLLNAQEINLKLIKYSLASDFIRLVNLSFDNKEIYFYERILLN